MGGIKIGDIEESLQIGNSFLDKDLDAALDSFDNLFCRRCLVSSHLSSMIQLFFVHSLIISFFISFCRCLIADYMDVPRTFSSLLV